MWGGIEINFCLMRGGGGLWLNDRMRERAAKIKPTLKPVSYLWNITKQLKPFKDWFSCIAVQNRKILRIDSILFLSLSLGRKRIKLTSLKIHKTKKCQPVYMLVKATALFCWGVCSRTVKVTRPSYFVRVASYFEAVWYPHLYFWS